MGFKELAQKQARNAFKLAGNLLDDVTLTSSTAVYDSTSQDVTVNSTSYLAKGLMKFKKSNGTDSANNTITAELTFLSELITDISVYDTATIKGITWQFLGDPLDDGFLTTVRLTRS